mgnify:CR=1 FL=1
MELIRQIENLNSKIDSLEVQKETLNFAYRTLEARNIKEEEIQKKNKRQSILQKAARTSSRLSPSMFQQFESSQGGNTKTSKFGQAKRKSDDT